MLNLWPLRIGLKNRKGEENGLNELILLAFCTLALIAPFFLRPNPSLQGTHTQLFLPPCIFYYLTHVPCPFCGATTSFTLLAHGFWIRALSANPWGPIFAAYVLALAVFLIAALIKKRSIHLEVNLSVKTALIMFGVIWVIKLLVWYGRAWI